MKFDNTWRINTAVTEHAAVTIGASSTQIDAPVGTQTYAVRLAGTGAFHYMVGLNAVATAKSPLMGANTVEIVACSPGDTVAIIQEAGSSGKVTVTEMTH